MFKFLSLVILTSGLSLWGCSGSSAPPGDIPPPPPPIPAAPTVDIEVGLKKLIFSWAEVAGSTHYRLLENADGHSGFTQVGDDIPSGTMSVTLSIAVHFQDFTNALYIVQACNVTGCNGSTEVHAMNGMLDAIGYFKASNTEEEDDFGRNDGFGNVALSADGSTLAVGAAGEDSSATGIDGDQTDNSAQGSGAVYLFRFDGTSWSQQAYIKASNTDGGLGLNDDDEVIEVGDGFGAVALSADGNTLAVGAKREASSATGINGDQNDNSVSNAGAVYLFRFDGTAWSQQAYVKASNTGEGDWFGSSIALSDDASTLAVGARFERSSAIGINGDTSDDSTPSGAVYLFRFDGAVWSQHAYIKASNTGLGDNFGSDVELSADGNTLAVAAPAEDSNATGINGDQNDNSVSSAGAVYLFRFDGTAWSQQAYVKASNTGERDQFGSSIALSGDATTLAVTAILESSSATGIDGDQTDNSAHFSGATYVFRFDGTAWTQQAYVKASNTEADDLFGSAATLTADGNTLTVGALKEDSNATGISGDQNDNSVFSAGAVYLFRFDGTAWSQQAYVKASNTGLGVDFGIDIFGESVAMSADGTTLAVGAGGEDSNATGIDGDQTDNSAQGSGAVYLY